MSGAQGEPADSSDSRAPSTHAAGHDVPAQDVPFHMARTHLHEFPHHTLPPGYRFRTYRPGDDIYWTALHQAAEPYFSVTPELWVHEFSNHLDALADRMFFVESEAGEVVASITAWWERDRHNPQERGRIHWVVVHPAHQRKGLSKPMMTRAMQRLAESHQAAMLGTSSGRLWAVKVYLDFGFLPDPEEVAAKPAVLAGWREVQSRLRHPALGAWLVEHR